MTGNGTVEVYVGAGSNIDPARNLRLACAELGARFGELQRSSVYRTRAVGFDGPDFLNMVIGFSTGASPTAIEAELERIHELAGRQRGDDPFTDRTLDLDLLLYGDRVSGPPGPEVPRSDVRKYAFVLAPLAELAPALRHPVTGETIGAMWQAFDAGEVPLEIFGFERLDD